MLFGDASPSPIMASLVVGEWGGKEKNRMADGGGGPNRKKITKLNTEHFVYIIASR